MPVHFARSTFSILFRGEFEHAVPCAKFLTVEKKLEHQLLFT